MAFYSRACQTWIRLQNSLSAALPLPSIRIQEPQMNDCVVSLIAWGANWWLVSTGQRRNTITVETLRASNNQWSSCLYLALSLLLEADAILVCCYWCKQSSCRGFSLCESGSFSMWPSGGFAFSSFFFTNTCSSPEYSWELFWQLGAKAKYCHLVPPRAVIIAPLVHRLEDSGSAEKELAVAPCSTNIS